MAQAGHHLHQAMHDLHHSAALSDGSFQLLLVELAPGTRRFSALSRYRRQNEGSFELGALTQTQMQVCGRRLFFFFFSLD